jgi:hypothetical protein
VQMGTIDIAFVTGMGMSSVGDMGNSVLRSVRSSTAEVDRRQTQHYAVDLPCRVGIAGRTTQAGRLADPGETGASITDTAPLPIGQRGVLDFDGLGQKLPFIVLEAADGLLGVGFEPDAAAAEVFRGVPHSALVAGWLPEPAACRLYASGSCRSSGATSSPARVHRRRSPVDCGLGLLT